MKKPLILSTLLLLSAGCGGSSGGGTSSPEAVAKALVKAVDKGSSKAVTGLFPTESVIKSVFDCPDKAHYKDLMEEINEERDEAGEEIKKMNEGRPKGIKLKFKSFEAGKSETMKAGEEEGGCTLKSDITIMKGKVTVEVSQDGETDSNTERVEIGNLNGKYYLVGM
jgi:hypothetical protein